MNDTIIIFRNRAERFAQLLSRVDGRWDAPTPCTDWTVHDVVRHVIDSEREFLDRHQLPVAGSTPDADPERAWNAHAEAVLAALSADGVADRGFDGYFGPTTIGDTMANFYGWDLAVHAWDVARATGQDSPIDDAEARELAAGAEGWGAALYGKGVCGPALTVAADASEVDKLLAMVGRDPHWTA